MHRPTARRPRRLAGALTLVAVTVACGGSADDSAPTVVDVAAQPCDSPNRDLGLGVLVDKGIVATAAHTVDGPRRAITVDGMPAEVLDVDARIDIALLAAEIEGRPAQLSVSAPDTAVLRTIGDERPVDLVRTGELVVNDATAGTRHRRGVHTFTPAVDAGTSGAPLVDANGKVLGIVVLANRGDGTAYAVTAAEIADLLDRAQREAGPAGCPG